MSKKNGQWTPEHDKALAGVLGNNFLMHDLSFLRGDHSDSLSKLASQIVSFAELLVDAVEAKKSKKAATLSQLKLANAKLEALSKTQARNIDELKKRIATLEAVQEKYGKVRYRVEDLNNALPRSATKPDIDLISRLVGQAMEICHPKS